MNPSMKSFSEQIKRKRYEIKNTSTSSSSEDENADELYSVNFLNSNKQFAVAEKIKLNTMVKRCETYNCQMLKIDGKHYIKKDSMKFQKYVWIEDITKNKLSMVNLLTNKKSKMLVDESDDDENETESNSATACSSLSTDNSYDADISSFNAVSTTKFSKNSESVKDLNSLRDRLTDLTDKLNLHSSKLKRFEYKGKCLCEDFHGVDSTKWALKVADHLFTKDELANNLLEKSSKTTRGHLSPNRVFLLKEAMKYKYQLSPKSEDEHWSNIKSAINSKGRTIKYNLSIVDRIKNTNNKN